MTQVERGASVLQTSASESLAPQSTERTAAEAPTRSSPFARFSPGAAGWFLVGAFAMISAYGVHGSDAYTPGSDLGYALGLTGGTMMLVLLLYPLRKHVRLFAALGPLKYWFRLHMVCGALGPIFVLFHSTFQARSLNATVALSCMLLVAASGIVGRFIYRRIHNGLYGSRTTLRELREALDRELSIVRPLLTNEPAVRREVEGFLGLAAACSPDGSKRTPGVLALGLQRIAYGFRIRRMMYGASGAWSSAPAASPQAVRRVVRLIDDTLEAAQRTAQFSVYERLFALWHVVHIPFVYMLVISAVVHVVAVHMY